jgi:PKD repeat protein
VKKLIPLLILFMFFLYGLVLGQNETCINSVPFCTEMPITYSAGIQGTAEPGAYYSCLQTQPAPAWFHMVIENPGDITIYMFSTPLVDIDFICWGPFTDPYEPCVQGLSISTVVDCSYSPNPTEFCDIEDGLTGEYYILMITNYSQQPTEITFEQSSGGGTLNCDIVTGLVPAFTAQPLEGLAPLEVQFTDISEGNPDFFKWDFQNDGIYDAFVSNPSFTYSEEGQYSVKLWVINDFETDSAIYTDYITANPFPPLLPDLAIVYSLVNQSLLLPGVNYLAIYDVENTGNDTASANYCKLFLSSDTLLDQYDIQLAEDSVEMLPAGEYQFLYDTIVIGQGTPPGDYFVLFVADHDNLVEESNEDNNLAYFPVTVDSTVGLNEYPSVNKDAINVYPNPANNLLILDFTKIKEKPFRIELFNMPGSRVFYADLAETGIEIIPVDISTFVPGLYILRMRFRSEVVNEIINISR